MISYKPLRFKLKVKGLSIAELEERSGVRGLEDKMESKSLNMEHMDKICEALGCEVSEVIEHIKGEAPRVRINWEVFEKQRKFKDWPITELGELCGLNRSTLGKVKARDTKLDREIVHKLAEYLRIDPKKIIVED